jgi:hypothetical protein
MNIASSLSTFRPAGNSSDVRDDLAERPSRQRSRVTNGSKLIAGSTAERLRRGDSKTLLCLSLMTLAARPL